LAENVHAAVVAVHKNVQSAQLLRFEPLGFVHADCARTQQHAAKSYDLPDHEQNRGGFVVIQIS
jgi:hypothetical protein